MKVRFIRDAEITHPDLMVTTKTGVFDQSATAANINEERNKVHRGELTPDEYHKRVRIWVKAGHVLENQQAFWLVRLGVAEPYDQEAIDACRKFDVALPMIQAAQERLSRGQATGERRYDASDKQADNLQATLQNRHG